MDSTLEQRVTLETLTVRRRRDGRLGRLVRAGLVGAALITLAACATGREFQQGERAARVGNWDVAVEHYKRAIERAPGNASYRIALERASMNASRLHADQARVLEEQDQPDLALREYRRVVEYDPTNRSAAARVQELEKLIRDRIEASRPRPPIEAMREQARRSRPEPALNPSSRDPIYLKFSNTQLRDIFNFIANATGINVTYDSTFQDKAYSVEMSGVTLEQALHEIMLANGLFYKVLNERTIIVVPDNQQKRLAYEEQAIRTFYVSHADVTELQQMLNTLIRIQQPVAPVIAINKSANTITARASVAMLDILEKLIQANDKPRAEIVVDVEILEINRTRAKQYGLNLSEYALGLMFSPESAPGTAGGTGGTTGSTSTSPSAVSGSSFNLNTITRGISTADFYLAVPAAVMHALESDSESKLIAKPQLRGSEGEKLTLNLGDEVPVPSTTFTPIVGGGTSFNPLTSFQYRPVGVNVEIEPRVTYEGDIIMKLTVESSTQGRDVNIAGQNLPSFGSRKVTTRLRLRDGESNLLAGLLRDDERRSLQGFPGAIHTPVLKQLFSANDKSIAQTDIVMLLTPRIVRTHELTQQDMNPVYIGTQQSLGVTGPPPLIAGTEPEAAAPPAAPAAPTGTPPGAPPGWPGSQTLPMVPPGSSPIPGMVGVTPPPAGQPPAPPTPPVEQPAPPVQPPVQPEAPPAQPPVAQPPTQAAPAPPAGTPAAPPPAQAPATVVPPPGPAQVIVSVPNTEQLVAGGPFTVPVSISGASQMSTITVSVSYNPTVLRARLVQEGSFMRQGGATVSFVQQIDAAAGRVDITVTRTADRTGASGAGLIGAVVFDPIGAGVATINVSGAATAAGGAPLALQFTPASVTVK